MKTKSRLIKNTIWIVFALFAFLPLSSNAQKTGIERSGDILEIGLPLVAFGSSFFFQHNTEGTKQVLFTLGTTIATTYLLKYMSNNFVWEKDLPGFPSGHTSISFAAAGFIQKRYGLDAGIPAYLLASYVGYTRIHSGNHNVLDVLGGAAIGIVFAHLFTRPYLNENVDLAVCFDGDATLLMMNLVF